MITLKGKGGVFHISKVDGYVRKRMSERNEFKGAYLNEFDLKVKSNKIGIKDDSNKTLILSSTSTGFVLVVKDNQKELITLNFSKTQEKLLLSVLDNFANKKKENDNLWWITH